jgi:hypothetical protein
MLTACVNFNYEQAIEYEQAGKFAEAEKYYKDWIQSLDDNDNRKQNIKVKLLYFYINSNQLEKADRYMSFVIFKYPRPDKLRYLHHGNVADALYDSGNFRRAYYHYKKQSEFIEDYKKTKNNECNIDLLLIYAAELDSAMRARLDKDNIIAMSKFRFDNLLNSKNCRNDKRLENIEFNKQKNKNITLLKLLN